MSRWFVGSSSRRRSGSPASARASEARVSSPPENVSQPPVEVRVEEAEPPERRPGPVAPAVAARVLEPRLRARVRRERRLVVAPTRHRRLEPRQLAFERDEVGRARQDVLAERQRPVERRALVVERDSRPLLERELAAVDRRSRRSSIRSSVVLPAPFGPESATRSPRSTLNETRSKSGSPESSLRRFDAMTTATPPWWHAARRPADPARGDAAKVWTRRALEGLKRRWR